MKNKRLYLNGATVPTDYDIETNKWVLMTICIPNSVTWRAVYRGLIVAPTRYWFWRLDGPLAHESVELAKQVLESVNMICTDELNYNLREINFTLKHLLAQMADKKDIQFFIDKPAEPARLEDGSWNMTDNKSIETGRTSNLEVGSLLETNSITDVLKIALLDDGTIQFPDINPFSLESKIDTLNETATTAKDIHEWFATAFWGGRFADLNPFGAQTFFARFSATFNKEIPLTGYISESFYTLASKLNVNIVTSFNETNTDGVASNSYFRYLHTWLFTDWKLFQTVSEEIRDCICEAKSWLEQINIALWGDDSTNGLTHIKNSLNTINGSIAGLELNPTINVTVDACCEDTAQAINNIGDTITNLGDTITTTNTKLGDINNTIGQIGDNIYNDNSTVTTIDNGDNTYTTTIVNPPRPPITDCPTVPIDYPPIDSDDPQGETTEPYDNTIPKQPNGLGRNALCGYYYKTFNDIADFLDALLDESEFAYVILEVLGLSAYGDKLVKRWTNIDGFFIGKIPVSQLRWFVAALGGISGAIAKGLLAKPFIIEAIRQAGEDVACHVANRNDNNANDTLFQMLVDKLSAVIGLEGIAASVGYLARQYIEYNGLQVDSSYAQYCPCPIESNFSGAWHAYSTGNYNRPNIELTISMIDEFNFEIVREHWAVGGTRYFSTGIGVIDTENILLANATITESHFVDNTGATYPSTAIYDFTYTLNESNTLLIESGIELTR